MSTENNRHFAWADRLGINKILHDAINDCRIAYGTEEYRSKVFSLYHLIPDIREGPQLKKMINEYKQTIWERKIRKRLEQWREHNPDLRDELNIMQDEEEKIREDLLPDFFDYMYQMLENTGLGFYKSDLTTDEISLTSKTDYMEDDTTEEK